MNKEKKIKIHIKNNHWAAGSFPTDAEGEENFTITKEHLDEALKDHPEIKDKLEIFVDWDEENFEKSMSNSDILLAWNFPTKNLKKISPNLKWIHVVSAGVEHLLPLDWMFDDLVLTNSSGAHAKKAGEYGLMAILMLQNHMTKIVTNQKNKEFVSLFSNPIAGKTVSIFSIVITSLHPSTFFPFLFTPITFAPNDLICFAIEDPRDPVPTTTTVLPAIGLLNKETNSLFF